MGAIELQGLIAWFITQQQAKTDGLLTERAFLNGPLCSAILSGCDAEKV